MYKYISNWPHNHAKVKIHKEEASSQIENLASLPFAYMFYIVTIIVRVCIILGREIQDDRFKHYEDYDYVLAVVASTGNLSSMS